MREQIIGKYICEKKSVSRINITSLQRHVEIDRLIEFLVEEPGTMDLYVIRSRERERM